MSISINIITILVFFYVVAQKQLKLAGVYEEIGLLVSISYFY